MSSVLKSVAALTSVQRQLTVCTRESQESPPVCQHNKKNKNVCPVLGTQPNENDVTLLSRVALETAKYFLHNSDEWCKWNRNFSRHASPLILPLSSCVKSCVRSSVTKFEHVSLQALWLAQLKNFDPDLTDSCKTKSWTECHIWLTSEFSWGSMTFVIIWTNLKSAAKRRRVYVITSSFQNTNA